MSKRFWIITIVIQLSAIVIVAFLASNILVGVELFLIVALGDVLVALLILARKQWRQLAGLEEIERGEQ